MRKSNAKKQESLEEAQITVLSMFAMAGVIIGILFMAIFGEILRYQ